MASPSVLGLASLEVFDEPLSISPELASGSALSRPTSSIRRLSHLPTIPTVPTAGPSSDPQRYLFIAVRRGHQVGVFTRWEEADRQIVDYPEPVFKIFSTRLAAEAFIAGWEGTGRHSMPASITPPPNRDALTTTQSSSPRPLREHLAENFPSSVSLSASTSPSRQSYHARFPAEAQPLFADVNRSSADLSTLPSFYDRPPLRHSSTSFGKSFVRIPSPLRSQTDDKGNGLPSPELGKSTSLIGYRGVLSPPASPENWANRSSVVDRGRSIKARASTETELWASSRHRDYSEADIGLGIYSPHNKPPWVSTEKRKSNTGIPVRSPPLSPGLWADPRSASLSPVSAHPDVELGLYENAAPKFSRTSLRKAGVIMPVAAPRNQTASLLRVTSRPSSPSLPSSSPSSSSTSLASRSSSRSSETIRRAPSSPDRKASTVQTTQNELCLNEQGLLALSAFSPPQTECKHRRSSSSLSSDASEYSMSSLISGSSGVTSGLDPYDPIIEEDEDVEVEILSAKRDEDAKGSMENSSMRIGGHSTEKRNKGGMLKRLSQAFKLEKEEGRRGSL